MEAQDAANLIRELLSDVPEAECPHVVATAIGLAFGRVEHWDPSVVSVR